MDPAAAKQQIAERVKQATKFLVTVNANPTVDQLAACIGLTLLLNKMGKHATAVFSGSVPSTIEFLKPEKTIETNTDSLRDFIISLDKNKADKLRYKIEDQYVRIFITPYRTSLSEKDLVFSEGDFNVEAVIALGVNQRTQLDAAITAHGRILHDATIISINAGPGKAPDLGQINWQDSAASSLSEMLVSISEAFGSGLIDSQMATAFLTGIVAETQRFSNPKTTPKVMTMSAQLMAAGANQQLIASNLEPPPPPPAPPPPPPPPPKPPLPPAPPPKPPVPKKPKGPPLKPEGVIDISHDNKKQDEKEVQVTPTEIHIDELGNLSTKEELPPRAIEGQPPAAAPTASPIALEPAVPPPTETGLQPLPPVAEPAPPLSPPPPPIPAPAPPPPPPPPAAPAVIPLPVAPAQPPAPENHHSYLNTPSQSAFGTTAATGQPDWAAPYDLVPMDPFSAAGGLDENTPSGRQIPIEATAEANSSVDEIGIGSSIPMHQAPVVPGVDSARNAVDSAIASAPFDPAFAGPIASLNALPLEPVPVESAPAAVQPAAPVAIQPTAPVFPPMTASDTPMWVLPTNSTAPVIANQPPAAPMTPTASPGYVAPPPLPPPLTISPGVVIPNQPPPVQ